MHDNANNTKVVRTDIDVLLESYWSWLENWNELRDWEQAYLKALAWQNKVKDVLRE